MLRVGADEPGAFEELVCRYRPRLRGVLHRLVGNEGDIDSLVQEVFLRVYRARRRYRAQAQLTTWLFTIAKNLANNARRRQLTVRVFTEGNDLDGDRPVRQLQDDTTHEPLDQLEQEELATMVRQAVDGLKERQRRVILLNKFEGLDYVEVARIEGLTPQAVKSLLSRARANLRRALQGYMDQGSRCLPTAVVSG
jgi:RNA polymerase sigma-70 factor (ECF subfamily)